MSDTYNKKKNEMQGNKSNEESISALNKFVIEVLDKYISSENKDTLKDIKIIDINEILAVNNIDKNTSISEVELDKDVKVKYKSFSKKIIYIEELFLFVLYELYEKKGKEIIELIGIYKEDYFYGLKDIFDPCSGVMKRFADYYLKKKKMPPKELFVYLSMEQYEKKNSKAEIYFADPNVDIEYKILFDDKCEFVDKNIRKIRKLMELSTDNEMGLILEREDEKWFIKGLAMIPSTGEGVRLSYNGGMSWAIQNKYEQKFLEYYKGRYYVYYDSSYRNISRNIYNEHKENIDWIIDSLKKQKHGTAAIIASPKIIEDETNRLCKNNKGIKLLPDMTAGNGSVYKNLRDLSENEIVALTNIDGALFLDYDCRCYAIGVIVDGETLIPGDSGRGARYNSLKNYVVTIYEKLKEDSIAVVISEDGMVDVFSSDNLANEYNIVSVNV